MQKSIQQLLDSELGKKKQALRNIQSKNANLSDFSLLRSWSKREGNMISFCPDGKYKKRFMINADGSTRLLIELSESENKKVIPYLNGQVYDVQRKGIANDYEKRYVIIGNRVVDVFKNAYLEDLERMLPPKQVSYQVAIDRKGKKHIKLIDKQGNIYDVQKQRKKYKGTYSISKRYKYLYQQSDDHHRGKKNEKRAARITLREQELQKERSRKRYKIKPGQEGIIDKYKQRDTERRKNEVKPVEVASRYRLKEGERNIFFEYRNKIRKIKQPSQKGNQQLSRLLNRYMRYFEYNDQSIPKERKKRTARRPYTSVLYQLKNIKKEDKLKRPMKAESGLSEVNYNVLGILKLKVIYYANRPVYLIAEGAIQGEFYEKEKVQSEFDKFIYDFIPRKDDKNVKLLNSMMTSFNNDFMMGRNHSTKSHENEK